MARRAFHLVIASFRNFRGSDRVPGIARAIFFTGAIGKNGPRGNVVAAPLPAPVQSGQLRRGNGQLAK